jgi:hypothetical protein
MTCPHSQLTWAVVSIGVRCRVAPSTVVVTQLVTQRRGGGGFADPRQERSYQLGLSGARQFGHALDMIKLRRADLETVLRLESPRPIADRCAYV